MKNPRKVSLSLGEPTGNGREKKIKKLGGRRGGGHKELSEAGSEVRRIKAGVRISGQ